MHLLFAQILYYTQSALLRTFRIHDAKCARRGG